MGPATVAAVRAAAPSAFIDVHMALAHPTQYVAEFAAAGAARLTFQFEAVLHSQAGRLDPCSDEAAAASLDVASAIRASGCAAGVCIAPGTPAEAVAPLLAAGAVDMVDVLAVNPGRGGQPFQRAVLEKVRAIRAAHPSLPYLMVDGGITDSTAPLAAAAGANVLVSGSYIFKAPAGVADAMGKLQGLLLEHGV